MLASRLIKKCRLKIDCNKNYNNCCSARRINSNCLIFSRNFVDSQQTEIPIMLHPKETVSIMNIKHNFLKCRKLLPVYADITKTRYQGQVDFSLHDSIDKNGIAERIKNTYSLEQSNQSSNLQTNSFQRSIVMLMMNESISALNNRVPTDLMISQDAKIESFWIREWNFFRLAFDSLYIFFRSEPITNLELPMTMDEHYKKPYGENSTDYYWKLFRGGRNLQTQLNYNPGFKFIPDQLDGNLKLDQNRGYLPTAHHPHLIVLPLSQLESDEKPFDEYQIAAGIVTAFASLTSLLQAKIRAETNYDYWGYNLGTNLNPSMTTNVLLLGEHGFRTVTFQLDTLHLNNDNGLFNQAWSTNYIRYDSQDNDYLVNSLLFPFIQAYSSEELAEKYFFKATTKSN